MNTALAITHDAIVGFWDGTADDLADPLVGLPASDRPLEYLEPNRRMALLSSELCSRFKVTGTQSKEDASNAYIPGNGKLFLDENEIYSTNAPKVDIAKSQLRWLRNYADLRYDRLTEINVQLSDFLSFFGSIVRLDASAKSYTLEFLTAVQSVTYGLEMRMKHFCWTPRPIALSQKLQPVIQTPDHSSYPSGHSIEAFMLATLLFRLINHKKPDADNEPLERAISGNSETEQSMLFRTAHRIAVNRTVAGVHYPMDSAAGSRMGIAIGQAVWAMLTKAKAQQIKYSPPELKPEAEAFDFLLSEFTLDMKDVGAKQTSDPITAAYFKEISREWRL